MPTPLDHKSWSLTVDGIDHTDHAVPAIVLANVLEAMQRTIHLLAMQREHREIGRRFRVPKDIEERFVVRCLLPREGSYEVPVEVGATVAHMWSTDDGDAVAQQFVEVGKALEAGEEDRLKELVPDSAIRQRVLGQIAEMAPRDGETWFVRFGREQNGSSAVMTSRTSQYVRELLIPYRDQDIGSVIGRLIKIDFGARKMTIQYPETGKAFDCTYDEEKESLLLEHARDHIQVFGNLVLDAEGQPIEIIDVEWIQEVDLSPIRIEELSYDSHRLRFTPTLIIEPFLDEETEQVFSAIAPAVGLDAYAVTRDDLVEEIRLQIDLLWRQYAKADDKALTSDAVALKNRLREVIEEVPHASR